jgi:hypothetical protein
MHAVFSSSQQGGSLNTVFNVYLHEPVAVALTSMLLFFAINIPLTKAVASLLPKSTARFVSDPCPVPVHLLTPVIALHKDPFIDSQAKNP